MRRLTIVVAVTGGILFAAAGTEVLRWHVNGTRSSWVTLKDPSSPTINIAEDPDSFLVLLRSAPSPVWGRARDDNHYVKEVPDVQGRYALALRDGRIVKLPNGTHAEVINRAEFDGSGFQPPTPGSIEAKRAAGRFEVLEIRVREGTFRGAVGWILPDLMQHDVTWP